MIATRRYLSLLLFLSVSCGKPATLHKAIRNGDARKVESLLKSGVDANCVDSFGLTALCSASYEGSPEMARLLIAHGADVNLCARVADEGKSASFWPLHVALERHGRRGRSGYPDYEAVAMLLISNGADVNIKDTDTGDNSPLHYATFSERVTEALIEHGADVNAKDRRGETSLHKAIRIGDLGVIPVLLSHGADPTIPNNKGKTPLEDARDRNRSNAVALIEQHLAGKKAHP